MSAPTITITMATFALIATLAAFGGDTWVRGSESIFKRVNGRGWVALTCLFCAFGLGIVKEVILYQDRIDQEKTEVQLQKKNEQQGQMIAQQLSDIKSLQDKSKSLSQQILDNAEKALTKIEYLGIDGYLSLSVEGNRFLEDYKRGLLTWIQETERKGMGQRIQEGYDWQRSQLQATGELMAELPEFVRFSSEHTIAYVQLQKDSKHFPKDKSLKQLRVKFYLSLFKASRASEAQQFVADFGSLSHKSRNPDLSIQFELDLEQVLLSDSTDMKVSLYYNKGEDTLSLDVVNWAIDRTSWTSQGDVVSTQDLSGAHGVLHGTPLLFANNADILSPVRGVSWLRLQSNGNTVYQGDPQCTDRRFPCSFEIDRFDPLAS